MANTSTLHSPLVATRARGYEVGLAVFGVLVVLIGSIIIGATAYGIFVVGGVFAVLLGLIVLLRPPLGLYFLVAFVFSNASSVIEESFGIPDLNKFLVALIFVGTLASHVVLQRKPLIFRITEMLILGYVAVSIMSMFFAPIPERGLGVIIDELKDFVIMLIIVQFATDEHVWKRAQWVLISVAGILAMLGTFQMITGNFDFTFWGFANAPVFEVTEGFDSNRITGPLDDPNYYAMYQLMVLPIALYRAMTDHSLRNRLWALVISVFIIAVVLATYSRGGFLTLLVLGALVIRERRLSPFVVGTLVVLIGVLVVPYLPVGFAARINTLPNLVAEGVGMQTEVSLRGRSSEAIVAMQMFQDRPILGIGRGHYADMYLDYAPKLGLDSRGEAREAHSLYLEIAAEMGVVGILSFAAMLGVLFRGMGRARKYFKESGRPDLADWVTGIRFGFIAFLLASVFLHASYNRYHWVIIGFAASCSVLAQALRLRLSESRIVSRISPIT